MSHQYPTLTHKRSPVFERDDRVAICNGYWCAHNSKEWSEVTCPDCLLIHQGKAYNGHARLVWNSTTNDFEIENPSLRNR